MSLSLWLVSALGLVTLLAGRQTVLVLLRPNHRHSDIERAVTYLALFAASWAAGHGLFEA